MSRGAVTGVAYSDGTNLRPGFLCRPLKAAPAPRPELGSGGGVFKLGAAQRGLGPWPALSTGRAPEASDPR